MKILSLTCKHSPYSLCNIIQFPKNPIGLLFGRGLLISLRRRVEHITEWWLLHGRSTRNQYEIILQTSWGKASYHTPLPTPEWKMREGFFSARISCGNEKLERNWGLTMVLSANNWTREPVKILRVFFFSLDKIWKQVEWRMLKKNVIVQITHKTGLHS